jgi:putative sugar O-methyltransferase
VLSDIIRLHSLKEINSIVEVGVGYGGQCKIIQDYHNIKSYTLVDLPEVLALAEKYLSKLNVKNTIFKPIDKLDSMEYDLFISNYAFTEIDREYQDVYADKLIKKSKHGYITCNFMANTSDGRMTTADIIALRDGHIIPEEPQTAPDNFIYTW